LPKRAAEVESPARKEEIKPSFWQANFSGPWTWEAFFIFPGPDFFTTSGKGRAGVMLSRAFLQRLGLALWLQSIEDSKKASREILLRGDY